MSMCLAQSIGKDQWPKCGGANGSIRFDPEITHGANAGLKNAVALLEPVKEKFPAVGYADLFQLASATAVEVWQAHPTLSLLCERCFCVPFFRGLPVLNLWKQSKDRDSYLYFLRTSWPCCSCPHLSLFVRALSNCDVVVTSTSMQRACR
jgi:hypothetical protein